MTTTEPAPYLEHQTGDAVEAICWQPAIPEAAGAAIGWLMGCGVPRRCHGGMGGATRLALRTSDGAELDVAPGDWVLRKGDLWTVLPDAVFVELFWPALDAGVTS